MKGYYYVLQTILPEFGFRVARNWSQIGEMAMTSRFSHMTSFSSLFDVALFLLSILVTGLSFMSISLLVLEL